MGFNNVTAPGLKFTVYESTVGLDVTRNKATGVKSHTIDINNKNEQGVVGLFCKLQVSDLVGLSFTTI